MGERLRKEIEDFQFDNIDKCTVSVGIASLEAKFDDAYQWLDAADKALYKSKNSGRNKVSIWNDPED